MDTAGPMSVIGLYGERFFLLAKDEATSYKKITCIESKNEIPDQVKLIISEAEYETGNKVLKIFTDCGTEYSNHSLRIFLAERGISHQTSTRYKPQQNGFIEREMRTVDNSARVMLNRSKLNHELWPEAVKTAVYVMNRLIASRDPEMTPYEKWFGRKPNVKNLRIFGQWAIVNRPLPWRNGKWDLTGDKMRFVGYSKLFNTYRFLNEEKGTIIESCDVHFIDKQLEPELLRQEAQLEDKNEINQIDFIYKAPEWLSISSKNLKLDSSKMSGNNDTNDDTIIYEPGPSTSQQYTYQDKTQVSSIEFPTQHTTQHDLDDCECLSGKSDDPCWRCLEKSFEDENFDGVVTDEILKKV